MNDREGEKSLSTVRKMSICQKYTHLHNWGVWPKMHQSAGHFFRCDNGNSPPAWVGLATRAGISKYRPDYGAARCWGPTQRPRITVPTHRHSAKNCFKTHLDLFEGKWDKLYRYDSMNTGFWNGCAPARAQPASKATSFVGECSYYYPKQNCSLFAGLNFLHQG